MKLGITIYSNDPETVWNAFRLANFALAWGDSVKVFLLGKGVEIESLEPDRFNVAEQVKIYLESGSPIYACGTCLQIRNLKISEAYTVATMKDLRDIIAESDKVVSF